MIGRWGRQPLSGGLFQVTPAPAAAEPQRAHDALPPRQVSSLGSAVMCLSLRESMPCDLHFLCFVYTRQHIKLLWSVKFK